MRQKTLCLCKSPCFVAEGSGRACRCCECDFGTQGCFKLRRKGTAAFSFLVLLRTAAKLLLSPCPLDVIVNALIWSMTSILLRLLLLVVVVKISPANTCTSGASSNPTPIELRDDEVVESLEKGAKRRKAEIWNHFIVNDIGDVASCKYCKSEIKCHSKKNGTTSLHTHFGCCKKNPNKGDPKQKILSFEGKKGDGCNLVAIGFSKEACRDALAKMVILDELPFRFVEGEGFRQFCSVAVPKLELPSRFTISKNVWSLVQDGKKKLKNALVNHCQRVCLTTDTWTSLQNINYMALTAHFIDNEWKLQKRILNFAQVVNHKGETMAKEIDRCLREWGIKKVFTITVDNASSNDVGVGLMRKKLVKEGGCVLSGEFLHIRCCAHIINLIVNNGLKDLHNSIQSIRNAVRYVRSSPSRLTRFKTCAKEELIECKAGLILDVPTSWNSTYLMLDSALKFEEAFERMIIEDLDYQAHFGEDEGGKRRMGPPKFHDWENAKVFVQFLKSFYDVTIKVSGSKYVTSNSYFSELCKMQVKLSHWSQHEDSLLKRMALSMKAKYDKYWGSLDKINKLLFVAVVLDPRYKLEYIAWNFKKIYEDHVADMMTKGVRDTAMQLFLFYSMSDPNQESNVGDSRDGITKESESAFDDAYDFEFECLKDEQDVLKNKNELDRYLVEPKEKSVRDFDVLAWWKANIPRYQILSQIARDVLAVSISTIAFESAFSTGGRILDPFRSSLGPKMVEALICGQNWLRSSHLPLDLPPQVEEALEDPDLETSISENAD